MWSYDINTHERYLIRTTPHTVTLSHLIDVESRLIYSSFLCDVSKVVTHLDYDVFYLDVHWARASATIILYAPCRCSSTPRVSLHSTSTMINVTLSYRRAVDDMNVFSPCVGYMSKYKEPFWNVFNTRALTLSLGIYVNHSVHRRYQHSWMLLDPCNTTYRDIESSHRRRIAINILIVFCGVSKVLRHLSVAIRYISTSTSHERRNHRLVCSLEMLFNPKMVS